MYCIKLFHSWTDSYIHWALFLCRPRCPRLSSVERVTLTEDDLTTDALADNENTKHWENVRDLPLLPSFVKAFNIDGILVCITYKAADGMVPIPQILHQGKISEGGPWYTL